MRQMQVISGKEFLAVAQSPTVLPTRRRRDLLPGASLRGADPTCEERGRSLKPPKLQSATDNTPESS